MTRSDGRGLSCRSDSCVVWSKNLFDRASDREREEAVGGMRGRDRRLNHCQFLKNTNYNNNNLLVCNPVHFRSA